MYLLQKFAVVFNSNDLVIGCLIRFFTNGFINFTQLKLGIQTFFNLCTFFATFKLCLDCKASITHVIISSKL